MECQCVCLNDVPKQITEASVCDIVRKHLQQGHLLNAKLMPHQSELTNTWVFQFSSKEDAQKLCKEIKQEEIRVHNEGQRTIRYEMAKQSQVPADWKYREDNASDLKPAHGYTQHANRPVHTAATAALVPDFQTRHVEQFQSPHQPIHSIPGMLPYDFTTAPTVPPQTSHSNQYYTNPIPLYPNFAQNNTGMTPSQHPPMSPNLHLPTTGFGVSYGPYFPPYQHPNYGQIYPQGPFFPVNQPFQQPNSIHLRINRDQGSSGEKSAKGTSESIEDDIHTIFPKDTKYCSSKPELQGRLEKKDVSEALEECPENNTEDTHNSIKIKGTKNISSKETLELYFENGRRSGGGDIEEITYDDNDDDIMFIQYKSAANARRVLSRKHKMEGIELVVCPYIPPKPLPYCDDKVLIDGLKPDTTEECLFNFLEVRAKCEPNEMAVHEENKSIVLITMDNEIDFERLQQACGRYKLEGATLSVSRVRVTNCILVTNLPDTVTNDTVQYYFENKKRSGGGPVQDVILNEDRSACFIYFEDYTVEDESNTTINCETACKMTNFVTSVPKVDNCIEIKKHLPTFCAEVTMCTCKPRLRMFPILCADVDGVMKKSHTLNHVCLNVKRYEKCLGRSRYMTSQKKKQTPDDFTLKANKQKIKFLKNSKSKWEALENRLQDFNAVMKVPDYKNDHINFHYTVVKSNKTTEHWEEDITTAFNAFMDEISVYQCTVHSEGWWTVQENLKSITIENPGAVLVTLNESERIIHIVGEKTVAKLLFQQLEDMILLQKKASDLKSKVTKEMCTTLTSGECKMLQMIGFKRDIEDTFSNMKVIIDEEKNNLIFEGLPDEIKLAKLKMYEMKNKFGIKTFEIHRRLSLRLYRSKETNQYIKQVLDERKLQCLWELDDDTVTVYSANADKINLCVETIRMIVVEHKVDVNAESMAYLETEEFKQKLNEVQHQNKGKVYIEICIENRCVNVCAIENIADNIIYEIEKAITRNALLQEKIECTRDECVFIERHRKSEIKGLIDTLQAYRVHIRSSSTGFVIQGIEDGMRKAKRQMQEMLSSIKSRNHTVDRPYFALSIRTASGREHIHAIENDLSCVITFKEGSDEYHSHSPADNETLNVYASCRVKNDVVVQVAQCDISKISVSVIVHNTDEKLSMSYGLGKILALRGGKEITGACSAYIDTHGKLREGQVFVSPAGNLQAKYILHVKVPGWQRAHKAEDKLERAVFTCLEKAEELKVSSLAIPAIGCGAARFPVNTATEIIVSTIEKFFRKKTNGRSINVILCDMKSDVVEEFKQAVLAEFGKTNVKLTPQYDKRGPQERHYGKQSENDYRRKGLNDTSKAKLGNITASVIKGAVAKQKVDAIVNVVDKSLDLKRGTVSASLLDVGGVDLQQELSTKCPNGLEHGQVAVTSGQKLTCRYVIYCRLGAWSRSDGDSSIKALQTLMKTCLNAAHAHNLSSVVFPAVGTGKLGYPKDVVAKEMFTSVEKFSNDNQQSALQEVRFVIYQDDVSSVKAFEAEASYWASGKRHGPLTMRKFNTSYDDGERKGMTCGIEDEGEELCYLGQIKLTIKQGDILEEEVHCIVNSIPYSMDLRKGAVSRGIYRKCGHGIATELGDEKDLFRKHGVVTTSARGLSCMCVIHVAIQETADGWKGVVEKALEKAEDKQMTSIAFPALGTRYRIKPKEMARSMMAAIVDFETSKPRYVNDIRLIIHQHDMLPVFQSAAHCISSRSNGRLSEDTYTRRNNEGRDNTRSKHTEDPDKVTFTILAMENGTIDRAASRVEKFYEQKVFQDKAIKNFNKYHKRQLDDIAKQKRVATKFDWSAGRIELYGFSENIRSASDDIHRLMREALEFEKNQSEAELLSHMIQWCYLETNGTEQKRVPYEKYVNLKIEKAYRANEASVTFRYQKVVFKIEFQQMHGFPLDKVAEKVNVFRKDIAKESSPCNCPTSWTNMTGNLSVAQLATTDKEYVDTEKAFRSAVGATIKIVMIERVQNKMLWQQYQAKKQQMEQQNPQHIKNENWLWHGTSAVGIDNIKMNGFDRSYSSLGCAIGAGIYFATAASTSVGYSRPDSNGIKKMFYSRVLTGEYAQGVGGIRYPPPKPSGGPNAKYDSVANNTSSPSVYVIFNDTQAYPEYIVSYKN